MSGVLGSYSTVVQLIVDTFCPNSAGQYSTVSPGTSGPAIDATKPTCAQSRKTMTSVASCGFRI